MKKVKELMTIKTTEYVFVLLIIRQSAVQPEIVLRNQHELLHVSEKIFTVTHPVTDG